MRRFTRPFVILCVACCFIDSSAARGDLADLARRVPAKANTLVLVNAEKILASQIAKQKEWHLKLREAHQAGITVLPPEAKYAVFASELDLSLMTPLWEVAAMEFETAPDFAAFTKRAAAITDSVGKHPAAVLPGDAYVVQFAPTIAAAISPGNRQLVARWVRETDARKEPGLSAYLTEAFGFANDLGTPLILAIDLDNVATPADVRGHLAESDLFKNRPEAELDKLATALASIRGLTLGVTLGETIFGKIKVDFEEAIPLTPEDAKATLLHALKKRGVMLSELETFTPKVAGKQVTLEGNLTGSGMKRLFSLFSSPPAISPPPALPDPTKTQPKSESDYFGPAAASRQYYKQMQGFLTDLRRDKADSQTMGASACWYETYARKIDQLSVLNVDPELAKFGAYAADSLRAACGALRGSVSQSRIRETNAQPVYDTYTYGTVYGYTYRDSYYGGGLVPQGTWGSYSVPNTTATAREHARIRTEERNSGYQKANEIMQQVESASVEVRNRMTNKYKVEFNFK